MRSYVYYRIASNFQGAKFSGLAFSKKIIRKQTSQIKDSVSINTVLENFKDLFFGVRCQFVKNVKIMHPDDLVLYGSFSYTCHILC